MYYDGKLARNKTLKGESQSNTGDLYIGKDPWYQGVVGAGFDNIQIHNRALTSEEIGRAASGEMLVNDNCVLALDFTGGIHDGHITDLSTHKNHAKVVGNMAFPEGESPVTKYVPPDYTKPSYMTVDGVNDYLVIDHTDALALGANNGDFAVSFALI